jgi:hypothetical protein
MLRDVATLIGMLPIPVPTFVCHKNRRGKAKLSVKNLIVINAPACLFEAPYTFEELPSH